MTIRGPRRRPFGRTGAAFLLLAGIFGLAALAVLLGASAARADELAYVCEADICTIDANNPETHADITETHSDDVAGPAWSPDGTRIAFSGGFPPNYGDVYVTSPSTPGTGIDISDSAGVSDGQAAWSADGTELAWEGGSTNGDIYIYFAAADGTTTPQAIAATPEGGHVQDRGPTWSPVGASFAFARHTSIYLATPGQTTTAHALPGGLGLDPSWSPDGTRIAAISAYTPERVRLINADGSGVPLELPVAAQLGSSVSWSPDSAHVVYVDEEDEVRVAPTNPIGAGFTIQLPPGVIVPHNPSFSPDGTEIVFSARNNNQSPSYEHLYLAPAGGGEAVQLTKAAESDREPVWRPDPGATPPPGTTGGGPPSGSSGGSSGTAGPSGAGSGGGTRQPVTVTFASYRRPVISNGFLGAAFVDCSLGSTNAACQVDGEATYDAPITSARTDARRAPKNLVFAKGAVSVPHGKTVPLRLKVTSAGRKLLKPGRSLKLTLSIVEKAPGAKPQTTTKRLTVKVRAPRK